MRLTYLIVAMVLLASLAQPLQAVSQEEESEVGASVTEAETSPAAPTSEDEQPIPEVAQPAEAQPTPEASDTAQSGQRSAIAAQDLLTTGGPNALLCRPEGSGPFPVVIWNHGRVADRATLEQAKKGNWRVICESLAKAGYVAYVPVRDFEHGLRAQDIPYNVTEVTAAVDYAKRLAGADPSRIVLMGHSRGGLLTLLVGLDRRDLKALVLTAAADIPPYTSQAAARVSTLNVPVLLMVEKSDEEGALPAFNTLDKALRSSGRDVRSFLYDRGGGHYLFIRVDYWWDDLLAFLRAKVT